MIPDLQNVATLLEQTVNQFIVRPTGSPGLLGISGFLFDIIDDENVDLDSDITDHYVENNTAIQDHIALRPEQFTLKGFVAELTDIFPTVNLSILTAVQALQLIKSFSPDFTTQADQVYEQIEKAASQALQSVSLAENLFDLFNQKNTSATRQQRAYNFFYSMWASRQLCQVETPWNIFLNMAIDRIKIKQDAETKMISDIHITFKKIRQVKTITSNIPIADLANFSGRAADMVAENVSNAQTQGQASILFDMTKFFFNQ